MVVVEQKGQYWPNTDQFYAQTGHNAGVWKKIGPATLFSPGTYLLAMGECDNFKKGSVTRIEYDGIMWRVMDRTGHMRELQRAMSQDCLFMYFDEDEEGHAKQ